MSTYRVENRTKGYDWPFDDFDELLEYRKEHINDDLLFFEECKGNDVEFYIDEDEKN